MATASSDASAVDIRGLDVTFATDGGDVHAVRGVSLDVRPGEVLAIVGESGSGKTVTARTILGLLPETALTQGAVVLDGTDVVGLDRESLRRLRGTTAAMIFQEPSTALNPVFTVGWQLAEGLRAHGKYTKKQARARAIEMLAGAETLYILARRRSYPVASYLAYALGKLGVRYQLIESAAGLDPEMIAFASPKDAVLVVSFSPYAPATVEDARGLAERGVPLVAITDSAFSPLAAVAKLWFEVAEADYGGFRTLSSTMALAMALAVGIGEARRAGGGRGKRRTRS